MKLLQHATPAHNHVKQARQPKLSKRKEQEEINETINLKKHMYTTSRIRIMISRDEHNFPKISIKYQEISNQRYQKVIAIFPTLQHNQS